ncbi:hypothetical protein [Poseidonia sp.]
MKHSPLLFDFKKPGSHGWPCMNLVVVAPDDMAIAFHHALKRSFGTSAV